MDKAMKLIKLIKKRIFRVRLSSEEFRKFKAFITNFYDYHFAPEFHYSSFRITKCRIYNYPSSITIEIHALAPGMIIGPYGKHIDALKEYMAKRYSKPIIIDLQETNPFK